MVKLKLYSFHVAISAMLAAREYAEGRLPLWLPVILSRKMFIWCTRPNSSNNFLRSFSSISWGTWPTNIFMLSGSGCSTLLLFIMLQQKNKSMSFASLINLLKEFVSLIPFKIFVNSILNSIEEFEKNSMYLLSIYIFLFCREFFFE